MSLKFVDLQMAVHRNGEAGLEQNRLLQKPVHDQSLLGGQHEKQLERQRRTSAPVSKSEQAMIRDGEARKDRGERPPSKKRKPEAETAEERTPHPYKGKHIDLTL